MTKPPNVPGRGGTKGNAGAGRSEPGQGEDRPFAEIRRVVHDVLRITSLHRWAFFIPFCVVTCSAFILSLYYPRTYTASTSFERRNDPVMLNLPMSAGAASFRYFRETMVRDLTSIECMREVSEALGFCKNLERDESGELTAAAQRRCDAVARSLGSTLSVGTTSPSELLDIVTVTYTGPDPNIGRALVDEVKRTYIQRTMTWIHDYLAGQQDYFQREAHDALEEVKRAQREETQLRLENPHVDPSNPGAIALSISQLEMERRELQMRQREYEAELSALRQALAADVPQPVAPTAGETPGTANGAPAQSPQTSQVVAGLREVNLKIEELRAKRGVTDQHPEMCDLIEQRKRLTAELETHRRRDEAAALAAATGPPVPTAAPVGPAVSGERARLMVQIAAQEAKLKDIAISLDANEQNAQRLSQAKDDVFQKQEEFADAIGAVSRARQRHQQIEATLASIEPAIKAIEQDRLLKFDEGQPAGGSSRPISPKAATVVLLALLAGLAGGVVFVILAEVFDNIYRSSGQVAQSLGLPMLESIDEIVTGGDRRSMFLRNAVMTPVVVVCFLGLAGLTGSMAYLSIERPSTYQRIRRIPEAAIRLFAGPPATALPPGTPNG